MGGEKGMSISSAPWGSALVLSISYAYIKDAWYKRVEVFNRDSNFKC